MEFLRIRVMNKVLMKIQVSKANQNISQEMERVCHLSKSFGVNVSQVLIIRILNNTY